MGPSITSAHLHGAAVELCGDRAAHVPTSAARQRQEVGGALISDCTDGHRVLFTLSVADDVGTSGKKTVTKRMSGEVISNDLFLLHSG